MDLGVRRMTLFTEADEIVVVFLALPQELLAFLLLNLLVEFCHLVFGDSADRVTSLRCRVEILNDLVTTAGPVRLSSAPASPGLARPLGSPHGAMLRAMSALTTTASEDAPASTLVEAGAPCHLRAVVSHAC